MPSTVRLKIRVRLADGSRPFLEPVFAGNAKLKPFYALVNGRPERHPEGAYFLRYAPPGGKRVWEPVGTDAQLALHKQMQRERMFEAKAAGLEFVEEQTTIQKTPLRKAIAEYLNEVKDAKSAKTHTAYARTLRQFAEMAGKQFLEDVNRKDVLAFINRMRQHGLSPRTQHNRVAFLTTFLTHFGIKSPLLKTDRIKFTEKSVSAYSEGELKTLFHHADAEERDLFSFFLNTGCRDGEVQNATWADIDFGRRTYTVRERLDIGFRPKDKEEGSIPLPDVFIMQMQLRKAKVASRFIFPGLNGKQHGHFLRILKRLALRAGLNCGNCYDEKGRCCFNHPTCERFILHRFRKTFATFHHNGGVPARTIQKWLRHSSLETTLRYLAESDDQSEKTRALVNATFALLQAA